MARKSVEMVTIPAARGVTTATVSTLTAATSSVRSSSAMSAVMVTVGFPGVVLNVAMAIILERAVMTGISSTEMAAARSVWSRTVGLVLEAIGNRKINVFSTWYVEMGC